MTRRKRTTTWLVFLLLLPLPALVLLLLQIVHGAGETAVSHHYSETIPVYQVSSPLLVSDHFSWWGGGNSPVVTLLKQGPDSLSSGTTAVYTIHLTNSESLSRTYQLTDTLPFGLTFVSATAVAPPANDLAYDPATRTLTWQGLLAPGQLNYIIQPVTLPLPYLDLADFGAPNLCDEFLAAGTDCDDATITFNLGINGYQANLYGQPLNQLTVASDGLLLGYAPQDLFNTNREEHTDEIGAVPCPPLLASPSLCRHTPLTTTFYTTTSHNQWLPDSTAPNFLLAGLWRDVDMTADGRWHAAILQGFLPGHDVFYAQWHNAPAAGHPDVTSRQAIALVLDGAGMLSGHAFYIYDNIADPPQLIDLGYTIGIEDKIGQRGVTYAYAGSDQQPQGQPPAAGTTLHLYPHFFGTDYSRTFTYTAVVTAPIPATLINTARISSDSSDPALATAWSTHYLYVRYQLYIPFFQQEVE